VAVNGGGDGWFLLNASPEVLGQIERFPSLHPRERRASPIRAVALTNGDLDHCLGLFSLREWHRFAIYATASVRRGLAERNVIYRTLERFPGQITWRTLELGRPTALTGPDGEETGLSIMARAVPGKLPVHLQADGDASAEDNVGLWIRDHHRGQELAYVPSAGGLAPIAAHLREASAVLFDGTFWSSDELVRLGFSSSLAEDMAHLPVGGRAGSLAGLASLGLSRVIFTHINNTNPMLIEGSPARRFVERTGYQIAHDSMEIQL
jgi:pyrroloquinoline quinone biosynthesis protein B